MKPYNDLPLVTVITPTYNRANYLIETIESVLSQDYNKIQYIVLDDGSTDNTIELLRKYNQRIILETHTNIGETRTVNQGFKMAKGEFITVINSDDPILPGAINLLASALMHEPKALVAYPDWVEIDLNSQTIKEMKLPDYTINNMLTEFDVAMGPGTMFRRSVLKEYGYRDIKRKYTGDLEFWFRLASKGVLLHVPEILATHRTHPNSASISDKSSLMAEELLSIVQSILGNKELPIGLDHQKNKIWSQAYYSASFYCPNEPVRRINYLLLSLIYDPRQFDRVKTALLKRK
jgi:glycosyltransferase involved in cell wall biosynthesis